MADLRVLIIAGPNGAGKTTFATEFLPNEADCPIFVNADLIAAGLSPYRVRHVGLQAGRLMLRQVHEHARRGDGFAFETTLSGLGYARWIPRWQTRGYRVKLFFLRLPAPEVAPLVVNPTRPWRTVHGHDATESAAYLHRDAATSGSRDTARAHQPLKLALTVPSTP